MIGKPGLLEQLKLFKLPVQFLSFELDQPYIVPIVHGSLLSFRLSLN